MELYIDKEKLLDQWRKWGSLAQELDMLPNEIPVDDHIEGGMRSLTRLAAVVREIDFPALKRAAEVVNSLYEEAGGKEGAPLMAKFDPNTPGEVLSLRWLFRVQTTRLRTMDAICWPRMPLD